MSINDQTNAGLTLGLHVGVVLVRERVQRLLPHGTSPKSLDFKRELLGMYALLENATRSYTMLFYPAFWTPAFSDGLSSGFRTIATNPGTTMRMSDVLRLPSDRERFLIHDWERVQGEGGQEEFFAAQRDFRDLFRLLQEVRQLEFAALAAHRPSDGLSGNEAVLKTSAALVDSALKWIAGTTTRGEKSLKAIAPLVDEVTSITGKICNERLS